MAISIRVAEGDVDAVFNGFTSGGLAILVHSQVVQGAVADGLAGSLGTIRPFKLFDGRHYCADDWHVILVAEFDGGDRSYSYEDAVASLSPIKIAFALDHVPFSTKRTALKRFLRPGIYGWDEAYGFQEGHIFAPSDLTVGAHDLSFTSIDPVYGSFENSIRFYIDPSGGGACI